MVGLRKTFASDTRHRWATVGASPSYSFAWIVGGGIIVNSSTGIMPNMNLMDHEQDEETVKIAIVGYLALHGVMIDE